MRETASHLRTHVSDHEGVSFRANRPLSQPSISRIRNRAEETNQELVFNDFRVLSRCNEFDTKTIESVLIHPIGPFLNNHEASDLLVILRRVYLILLKY